MATSIEKNTKKIMAARLQAELDNLFEEQQQLNNNSNGTYGQYGLEVGEPIYNSMYHPYMLGNVDVFNGRPNSINNPYSLGNVDVTAKKPFRFYENTPRNNTYNSLLNPFIPKPNIMFQDPTNVVAASQVAPNGGGTATGNVIPTSTGNRVPIMDMTGIKYAPPIDNWQPTMTTTAEEPSKMKFSKSYDDPTSIDYSPAKSREEALKAGPFGKKDLDWGKAGTFALQAAPAIYNMIKGLQRPDKVTPNYNPYENEIRSTMRNRRFNIDPILNANRTAQAVSNRNIRNVAGSRGELMGNLGASQNARMIGDATAWAQKNNMDNQYLSEQAQMDANLGQNRAQMDWMTQDANARNRTVTNQFMGQGINDIANLMQTRQLMNNQLLADKQRIGVMKDALGVYRHMLGSQAIEEFINSKK